MGQRFGGWEEGERPWASREGQQRGPGAPSRRAVSPRRPGGPAGRVQTLMDTTVSLKETHRRGELALKLPLFQHGSHEVTSALSSGAPGQSHGPQRTLLGGGAQGWALCQLGVRTRGFLWFLIHSLPRWVKPRPRLSPAPGGPHFPGGGRRFHCGTVLPPQPQRSLQGIGSPAQRH